MIPLAKLLCRFLLVNQKILIFSSAGVTIILGIWLIVVGIKLRTSEELSMFSVILASESNEAFSSSTMELILIIFAAINIVSGFMGCYGALEEHRGALCGYSLTACLCGMLILFSGVALYVNLEITSAETVREINRVCRSPALAKKDLGCTLRPSDNTYTPPPSTFSTPVQQKITRRLEPGTTELHLVRKICNDMKDCEDPCLLVDRLCVPPDSYDEATACVCAGRAVMATASGEELAPTAAPSTSGNPTDGSYCSKWSGADEEWCFVYPRSSCNPEPPGTLVFNETVGPFMSKTPCYQIPDARSSLVDEALGWLWPFAGVTIFMGCWLLFSTTCGCCLACEIHTGEKVEDHARNVIYDEDSLHNGSYSDEDLESHQE